MCVIPIKQITEDDNPVVKYEKLEIDGMGELKGNGKDAHGEFEIKGKMGISGDVKFDKTYKGEKAINYQGKINGTKVEGTFPGEGTTPHKFVIEISLKNYVDGKSIFSPFDPIPEPAKQLFGLTYDESATFEEKDDVGAWGVIVLEPRKEVGKREGKVYFLDGKVHPVKVDVNNENKTAKLKLTKGDKTFNCSDL